MNLISGRSGEPRRTDKRRIRDTRINERDERTTEIATVAMDLDIFICNISGLSCRGSGAIDHGNLIYDR